MTQGTSALEGWQEATALQSMIFTSRYFLLATFCVHDMLTQLGHF